MINPLATQYKGYKIVDRARKSGIMPGELSKIQSQMDDKYSKGWLYRNPTAQQELVEILDGIKS